MVKNPPAMQKTWVLSLGWEDPLEKGMATHSSTSSKEKQHLGIYSLDSAPTRWVLRGLGLQGATPYCSVTPPASIRTPSISSSWPRSVVGRDTENFFPLQAEGHTCTSLPSHAWSFTPQPASLQ